MDVMKALQEFQEREERAAVAVAKQDTSQWGYQIADNEQGWEGKIFPSKEARIKAGWDDTPHEFIILKEAEEEEERQKAAKAKLEERRGRFGKKVEKAKAS